MNSVLNLLRPGDLMAYKPKGFFGWVISLKTWHRIAHVEVYAGNGYSVASRDGLGVGFYPVRLKELAGVYRPLQTLDMERGMKWFYRDANGQGYDWKGILGFEGLSKHGSRRKQFCSEFVVNFYRHCGLELFSETERADKIAPFQLTICRELMKVWPVKQCLL